jgi:hypothetical protein
MRLAKFRFQSTVTHSHMAGQASANGAKLNRVTRTPDPFRALDTVLSKVAFA